MHSILKKTTYFVMFLASLFSCLNAQEAPKTAPVISVDAFKVTAPKQEPITLEYPAKTISSKTVMIKARANGVLLKQHFNEGSYVKEGTLLYTIEPDSYEASLSLAKASVANASVNVSKTQKEWERTRTLYEQKASSEAEKDTAYFAYEAAKASLQSAMASLHSATIALNRTQIKATISGFAGSKLVDVGNLVTEGMALVEITQSSPLHVEFSIPENERVKQLYFVGSGVWGKSKEAPLKASLRTNDVVYNESGVVDFMDHTLNPKTGALKARATFENKDHTLLPNQFVTLSLIGLSRKEVMKVPQKAILQNPLGTTVFVVLEGKVSAKPVKIAEASGNDFIIESGLKEGDLVIVNNFFRIKPGINVKIDTIINEGK